MGMPRSSWDHFPRWSRSAPRILQDNYQMKLSNDDYKGRWQWEHLCFFLVDWVDCHEVTSSHQSPLSFQVQRVPLPWMILRRESRLTRRSTSPFRCPVVGKKWKRNGGAKARTCPWWELPKSGYSIHSQTMGLSGRWAGLNSKVCKAWIVVILDQTIPFFWGTQRLDPPDGVHSRKASWICCKTDRVALQCLWVPFRCSDWWKIECVWKWRMYYRF